MTTAINSQQINFEKMGGLIPVIIQDHITLQVLMLGFMNAEAFNITQQTKRVTFYSRSKQRLWQKGETSGHYLDVIDMYIDCDNDTLLIMAKQHGATCHTGTTSCFTTQTPPPLAALGQLADTISERIAHPQPESYTNSLVQTGIKHVAQKVGEEGVEVALAAIAESDPEFLGEMTDLLYHALVLLKMRDLTLADLAAVITARHKP